MPPGRRWKTLLAVPIPVPALPSPYRKQRPVWPKQNGHVLTADILKLDKIAAEAQLTVHVAVLPGALVHSGRPLMHIEPPADIDMIEKLRSCFLIGKQREFDHDPHFGIIVLSEIASRALSPAVNDPGTAIEVADAGVRLFLGYGAARAAAKPEPVCKRVHAPSVEIADLLFDFFNPIARDGAAMLEVQLRLIEALSALIENQPDLFGAAAREHVRSIIDRSAEAMVSPRDRARLMAAAGTFLDED